MLASVAVQLLAVVGIALLKLLLVRRLVPQVEEAVEQYIRKNPEIFKDAIANKD